MAGLFSAKSAGHCDVEVSDISGQDFLQRLASCTRHPGHTNFIPFKKFDIEKLPKQFQVTDIYELVKLFAELTVRVIVTLTSKDRPLTFPGSDTPYPSLQLSGTHCYRAGSGWVKSVKIYKDNIHEPCPCELCVRSKKPRKTWGRIEVATAKHLVFNTEEAQATKIDLFYDDDNGDKGGIGGREGGGRRTHQEEKEKKDGVHDEKSANAGSDGAGKKSSGVPSTKDGAGGDAGGGSSRGCGRVVVQGSNLWYSNIKEDKAWIYCATHDVDLCEELARMVTRRDELVAHVDKTYHNPKSSKSLTILVSHIHACAKRISLGEWASREVGQGSPWWSRATYSNMTCAGSSGAPVWSLGKPTVEAWRVSVPEREK